MKEFIHENKIVLAGWCLWILINFAMWASPGMDYEKDSFYPSSPDVSISKAWNMPEVLIYGIGPLVLFIILKTVIKKDHNKDQHS